MFRRAFTSDCDRQRTPAATHTAGGLRSRWRARLSNRAVSRFDVAVCRLRAVVGAVAFWIAVAVPFLYLPLVARGLETRSELVAFVALLGVNLLAHRMGHRHRHPRDANEPS